MHTPKLRLPVHLIMIALLMTLTRTAGASIITLSYVNGQISSTSNFTTGTVTSVNLAQTIAMQSGQYFRFGIAVSVTNNPNPEFGTSYAAAANELYGVTYPANLGVSAIAAYVSSSDEPGTYLFPLNDAGKTRALFNNVVFSGASSHNGDVTGGIAGFPTPMFKGFPYFDPQSTLLVRSLGSLATPGANFIVNLPYQLVGSPTSLITLTPGLDLSLTTLWKRSVSGEDDGMGNIVTEANFLWTALGSGDSVVYPATNGGSIFIVPEPTWVFSIGVALLCMRRNVPGHSKA